MPDERVSAVIGLLERARENLRDAEHLLALGGIYSAVSRAYYAMLNAAQAALLSRGITRSRHRGVHSAFGYYFVRSGRVSPDLHDAFQKAYDKRIIADYSPQSVPRGEAEGLVEEARRFVAMVEGLLGKEGG